MSDDADESARWALIEAELAADQSELVARRQALHRVICNAVDDIGSLDGPTARLLLDTLREDRLDDTRVGDGTAVALEQLRHFVVGLQFDHWGASRLDELGLADWEIRWLMREDPHTAIGGGLSDN